MTDKELTPEEHLHARMLASALHVSGIIRTLERQTEEAIKSGKVTIAEASEHKRVLAASAAQSMARGIEAAFRVLEEEGFQFVRVEKPNQVGGDGDGSVPASGD